MTGHIFIDGEIGQKTTADTVRADIKQYPQATEWLVHINSQGGDVYEGYNIGNIIRNLPKTTANIGALCASIATYAACCCDTVVMAPAGDFMIHLPTGTLSGNAEDLRRGAMQLDRIKSELINRYMTKVAKKGITREQLSAMIDKETSMSPSEALAMGFVDEVQEKLKAVAKWDFTKFKNEDMTNTLTKEEAKGMFEAFGNKLDAFFKKFKNAVTITLADGSIINSDAPTVDAIVGSMLTDEQGNPLPAATYETADGLALVVDASGKVVSADPIAADKAGKPSDEVAKLQAEIATLKEQLASQAKNSEAQVAQVAAAAKENAEFKNLILTLKNDFDKLKNETIGDATPPKDAPDKGKATQRDPQLEAMAFLGEAFLSRK